MSGPLYDPRTALPAGYVLLAPPPPYPYGLPRFVDSNLAFGRATSKIGDLR